MTHCLLVLNGTRCIAVKSPWGPPLAMGNFTAKFMASNTEIRRRKSERFVSYILKAASGTLFTRPGTPATYVAYLRYHKPMWGLLQGKYDDVEAEINELRRLHLEHFILFVGGDGASITRLNHLINKYPDLYLDQTPFIIPMQGEAPHGVYHCMHAGWRLYWRFIKVCAIKLGNKQAIEDPPVKSFNSCIHFLWRITRAASEYLLELVNDPFSVPLDDTAEFIKATELNVDLAWLVHFLYDFAYMVLDFKQSVRAGDSHSLDLLWREFYASGTTSTANKTQYVPMAIMRIFWAEALTPDLAKLMHALRSIPMSLRPGSRVGWDTPIEWLNGGITEGVPAHVTETRIERFVEIYPLLQSNYSRLRTASQAGRKAAHTHMKDMDSDVNVLKDLFRQKVGVGWVAATAANAIPQLVTERGVLPWIEVQNHMSNGSVAAQVSRLVTGLTDNFYTWS